MMHRLYVALLSVALTVAPSLAFAQSPQVRATVLFKQQPAVASGGGGCSQATTFLARTSGLDATHTTAYTTMICGMVTDGTWSQLEALYILATDTTTNANLNLISTSYGLQTVATCNQGAPTFTADQGYTGNASAKCLDTQFTPSSNCVLCGQDNISLGAYVQTSRTTGCSCVDIGATVNGVRWVSLDVDAPTMAILLNEISFSASGSNANARGAYVATRTSSTAELMYKNGSTTPVINASVASTGTVNFSIFLFGLNQSGGVTNVSGDQASAFFIGKALSATDAVAINNRINTYMASLAAPVNVY